MRVASLHALIDVLMARSTDASFGLHEVGTLRLLSLYYWLVQGASLQIHLPWRALLLFLRFCVVHFENTPSAVAHVFMEFFQDRSHDTDDSKVCCVVR